MEKVTEKDLRNLVTRLANITGKKLELETRSSIYGPYRYRVTDDEHNFYPSNWEGRCYMKAQEARTAICWACELEWQKKSGKE